MMKRLGILLLIIITCSCGEVFESGGDASPGFDSGVSQGGSLARFTIVGDHLYIVNDLSLVPIDITDLQNPVALEEVQLGIGIETIFPYDGHLFIGSNSAVYIYSISDPASPREISVYSHSTGCDPVVVSGDYAYVTLRDGSFCQNLFEINVLDVVDVSNLSFPQQVASIQMTNPRGLGVGCNGKLYVCDGARGLVQFDLSDPSFPVEEMVYGDHAANDVIIRDDLVIMTGDDGVYQFSCASDTLELLSILPFAL